MKVFKNLLLIVVSLALTHVVMADAQQARQAAKPVPMETNFQEIKVATGSQTGTYTKIFAEIRQTCTNPPMQEHNSSGSIENFSLLTKNAVSVAFIQEDVLFGRRDIENDPEVDNVRTLLKLYPEEIHLVKRTNNGYIRQFADLGNKKVGVWGGSKITAWILFGKTGVRPAAVEDVGSPEAALAAINAGKIDAILAVGGQPLGWVEKLDRNFSLIPFDRFQQVANVYERAVVNYPNMASGSVPAASTRSLLVTLNYRSGGRMYNTVKMLRDCVDQNYDDIRETPGTHPKWRLIDTKAQSNWPSLIEAKVAPSPVKK